MKTRSVLGISVALCTILFADGASFQALGKKCRGVGCVGKAIEKGAQDLGHTGEKAAHDTGHTIEKAGQDVGREAPEIVDQARTDTRNFFDRIDPRITQFGRDFDRVRLEFRASVYDGPALEQWLRRSRESSINGAMHVPIYVRDGLRGWCSDALMNSARYRIGDGGELNLANNSIRFGSANAVTLIDVIVFKDAEQANNLARWAHELKHVQQFNEWGVRKFAIRYMRSWNSVENPGYAIEREYAKSPSPRFAVVPQGQCVL